MIKEINPSLTKWNKSEKVLMTFKWDQLVWGHQLSTSGHVSGHAWWYENIYLIVNMIAWLESLFLLEKKVRTSMDVLKSLMISKSKMSEFLTQTYMIKDRWKVRRNRSYNTMDPQLNRLAKLAKTIYNSLWVCLKLSSGFTLEILNLKILQSNDGKVCVLNLVQLEDDIGYFKSSHTDLLSSNWTRSKTQTLILTFIK